MSEAVDQILAQVSGLSDGEARSRLAEQILDLRCKLSRCREERMQLEHIILKLREVLEGLK